MPKSTPPAFFAIISDIHANIDALEAVLADIEQVSVRATLCLGDIIGYGPEPAACVQRVMDACVVSVLGNHEAMLFLADRFPPEELGAAVGAPIQLASEQLSAEQNEWLHTLPIKADLDPITLTHAALNNPGNFEYIHTPEEAGAHFAVQTTFMSFQGHTHVPAIWEEGSEGVRCYHPSPKAVRLNPACRYAVNVGSVGQPRDDDPRASYALYDYANRVLLHRRVEYDTAAAAKRFKKAGLPTESATRLAKGI